MLQMRSRSSGVSASRIWKIASISASATWPAMALCCLGPSRRLLRCAEVREALFACFFFAKWWFCAFLFEPLAAAAASRAAQVSEVGGLMGDDAASDGELDEMMDSVRAAGSLGAAERQKDARVAAALRQAAAAAARAAAEEARAAAAVAHVTNRNAVFERLFRAVSEDMCTALARQARPAEAEMDLATAIEHVYGEIRYPTFLALVERCVDLFRNGGGDAALKVKPGSGAMGRAPASFIDLGSGAGRPVFAAAMSYPFAVATGVELVEPLHTLAAKLGGFYERLFLPKFGAAWAGQKLALVNGDLLVHDWSGSDIVFCHCTCFGEALLKQFAKLCEKLAPGAIVVTVSHLLRTNLFEMVHTAPYVMTWGEGTVYIYRRKALPKWIGGLSIGGR